MTVCVVVQIELNTLPSFSFAFLSCSPDHPEINKEAEFHQAALENPKQPLCKYYLASAVEVQQPAC